jgi:hypothetical protein
MRIDEETGNYLQLFLYRAPRKNHGVDAARHNSKIILSLNDYANSVSKRILPNLLGAAFNIEPMDFLHHDVLLQQSVHGISDPTQNNNRLC